MSTAWFGGARTVKEQMKGLETALEFAPGKTVADYGCAEGLISARFAAAGATSVYACDINDGYIAQAKHMYRKSKVLHFYIQELTELAHMETSSGEVWQYDIVLALAILHKMHDPLAIAKFCAASTRHMLVVRLPNASKGGVIVSKHVRNAKCNLLEVMTECGLTHTRDFTGPRDERVWYFERR